MKLLTEPKSMRACAGTVVLGVMMCSVVRVRGAILGGSWMVLNAGRGGRMGQLDMICPSPPQYRQRWFDNLL